jgi:hypothetical protein
MPTRKQRRRLQKERRHEYETVWVDSEGNELDEPPEELAARSEKPEKRDSAKPKTKAAQQRGGRQVRVPPPPSWRRAAKRALIIGTVIFVFIYIVGSKKSGNNFANALLLALIYTALFIPFQFVLDRFAYNRYQRRSGAQPAGRPAKKR